MMTDPSEAKGSGTTRYAAAMQLYQSGQIEAGTLEEYRALANLDQTRHPEQELHVIRYLVAAIEAYLERRFPARFTAVRQGIAQWRTGNVRSVDARQLAACRFLAPALSTLDDPLAPAIDRAAPLLKWEAYDAYPRTEIGEDFAAGHAYASIIGESAPIAAEDFDLGLFVIAPHTLYRDHKHKAPELYVPLTGPHGWRFRPGNPFLSKPAHEPVWNEPYAPHATLTGEAPFLCLFCWTQDVNDAATVIPSPDWADIERLHGPR
jgi:hypothetical protein